MNDKRTRKQLVHDFNKLCDDYVFHSKAIAVTCAIACAIIIIITAICN